MRWWFRRRTSNKGHEIYPASGPWRITPYVLLVWFLIDDGYKVAEVGNGGEMQSRLGFEYEVLDSPIPTAPPSLIKGLGLRYHVFGSITSCSRTL